jgi:hypothetical protein
VGVNVDLDVVVEVLILVFQCLVQGNCEVGVMSIENLKESLEVVVEV